MNELASTNYPSSHLSVIFSDDYSGISDTILGGLTIKNIVSLALSSKKNYISVSRVYSNFRSKTFSDWMMSAKLASRYYNKFSKFTKTPALLTREKKDELKEFNGEKFLTIKNTKSYYDASHIKSIKFLLRNDLLDELVSYYLHFAGHDFFLLVNTQMPNLLTDLFKPESMHFKKIMQQALNCSLLKENLNNLLHRDVLNKKSNLILLAYLSFDPEINLSNLQDKLSLQENKDMVEFIAASGLSLASSLSSDFLKTPMIFETIKYLADSSTQMPELFKQKICKEASLKGILFIFEKFFKNNEGMSDATRADAVFFAANSGNISIVRFLLSNQKTISTFARNDALCAAAQNGHVEILNLLLSQQPPVSAAIRSNAIFNAAAHGRLGALNSLLAYSGEDISIEGLQEALDVAHESENYEIVKALRKQINSQCN